MLFVLVDLRVCLAISEGQLLSFLVDEEQMALTKLKVFDDRFSEAITYLL